MAWVYVAVGGPVVGGAVALATLWTVSDAAERIEARQRRKDCQKHELAAEAGADAANTDDGDEEKDWDRGPAVEIDPSTLHTGDVLIYDRDPRRLKCCGAIAARGVKALQCEAWDHVGIIYRPGGDGPAHVLEMSGKGLGDCPFEETVTLCSANSLYLRRLTGPGGSPCNQAEFDTWLEEQRKVPYENNIIEMYNAIHDSAEEEEHVRLLKELAKIREANGKTGWPEGGVPEEGATDEEKEMMNRVDAAQKAAMDTFGANQEGDDSSLFCSELVAEAWQKLGALPPWPPANEYVPRDWMTKADRNLPLNAGYRLSPPELVQGQKMPKNNYCCGCCRFCG